MDKDASAYCLYVMRHGIAVERGSPGVSDDDARALTAKGKKKLQQVTAGLRRLGFKPDWIVTSPLVRAEETAAIVAQSLASDAPMDSCDALRPGGTVGELQAFLSAQPKRRKVLLVGHEPDLSRLVAQWIGAGRNTNLAFRKGGCCLIQWDDTPFASDGQLVWWLTPRLLRAIAGSR